MKYVVLLSKSMCGAVVVEATSIAEAKREAFLAIENGEVDWSGEDVFVDKVEREEM